MDFDITRFPSPEEAIAFLQHSIPWDGVDQFKGDGYLSDGQDAILDDIFWDAENAFHASKQPWHRPGSDAAYARGAADMANIIQAICIAIQEKADRKKTETD